MVEFFLQVKPLNRQAQTRTDIFQVFNQPQGEPVLAMVGSMDQPFDRIANANGNQRDGFVAVGMTHLSGRSQFFRGRRGQITTGCIDKKRSISGKKRQGGIGGAVDHRDAHARFGMKGQGTFRFTEHPTETVVGQAGNVAGLIADTDTHRIALKVRFYQLNIPDFSVFLVCCSSVSELYFFAT